MTTTPKDPIDRFTVEAQLFTRLALVVMFREEARLMWSDGPNLRVRLNAYIEAGGLPIGTLGYLETADQLQFRIKVLEELDDIPFIAKHLAALLEKVKAQWIESQSLKDLGGGTWTEY